MHYYLVKKIIAPEYIELVWTHVSSTS